MAVLIEVSRTTLTFEPDVFRKKRLYIIASNLTLNMMLSLVLLVIVHTDRIACRLTDTHTHTGQVL